MELNDKIIPDLVSLIELQMKKETNGFCTRDFQILLLGIKHRSALINSLSRNCWIELDFKVPRFIKGWLFWAGYNVTLVNATEPGSCKYPSDAWDICDCNLCNKNMSTRISKIMFFDISDEV
jgi:hypothetical protein